jgi:hypothetical protein
MGAVAGQSLMGRRLVGVAGAEGRQLERRQGGLPAGAHACREEEEDTERMTCGAHPVLYI